MNKFKAKYPQAKPYLIGGQGQAPDLFFACEADFMLG